MALNQHPSSANAVSGTDKGELCTQKENTAIEEKEPNQSTTQVIGSALQPIQSQIVNHHTAMELSPEIQHKEKLIKLLKKEVKRMMEESVMLKIVYEESASVTSFCAIVDTCLSLGLKRRALGLFKTSSTAALLQKLAKENDDAAIVMRKAEDIEHTQSLTNSNSSITAQVGSIASNSGLSRNRPSSTSDSSSLSRTGSRKLFEKASSAQNLAITRFRWIRVALFEKKLQSIVCYIVQEADRFFTKDSLVADQDYGPILSSLLVGPCALEFTKVKPTPNNWSDLPAKELVQRHKISSRGSTASMNSMSSMCGSPTVFGNGSGALASHQPLSNTTSSSTYSSGMTNGNGRHTPGGMLPSPARSCQNIAAASSPHRNLTLNINAVMASPQHVLVRRSLSSHIGASGSTSASALALNNPFGFGFDDGIRSVPSQAREYVESLHQNQWDNLLYGKNNVHVLPKEGNDPVPGYLSLHQAAIGGFGCIKWSPNRLMNGSTIEDKSASWQQALNIDLNCIQFVHCHQAGEDSTGTVVLIAIDGTQHPPIQFPPGGHLMQFLTNIESSLLPYGMLEPPLWSERKQKEELKTASNEKRKQSNEEKTEKITEKVTNDKNVETQEGEENGSISNMDEKENKSPVTKKKRVFPFSLSRRKKEEKDSEDKKDDSSNKEDSNGDENSFNNQESSDALSTDKPQMSVMDPIDTVFKIVNLAPVGGSMSSLNVPGQPQSSNGSLLNPDVAGVKSSTPSLLSKSRTSEWFANLFSPSKSRNNSSSTDTSRSFSFSMSGEYPGGDDITNSKLGDQDVSLGRTRSARTSGGGSGVTDEEDEMIIMTTSSSSSSNPNINRPKLRLFKQHELDSLAENSLVPEVGSDTASDTDRLSVTPCISLTSPNVPKRKSPSEPISTMCSTMKRQIISRAFYGWLAHCRHLKTVRQHLSGLTFHEPTIQQNSEWSNGLSKEYWQGYLDYVEKQSSNLKDSQKNKKSLSCRNRPLEITVPAKIDKDNESKYDKTETNHNGCDKTESEDNMEKDDTDDSIAFSALEVYWRIYHGGIESSIRSQVWPYLFGHYKWDFSSKDRRDMDRKNQSNYENKLSDWMAIDAIVRQRDKEITAANIAKLSGTSSLERGSKDGSQDVLSTVDEVFTSIDETNTLSSRTVSQDKISTITELTENSTSEELKSRSKLSSGHSEGGGLDKSISLSSNGTGRVNIPEALTRCSSNPCSGSPKHQNSPKTSNHGENIKSFFTNQFSFGKKDVAKTKASIVYRKASDEGIEDESNAEIIEELEKKDGMHKNKDDQSTSGQIDKNSEKGPESEAETKTAQAKVQLFTNSSNSSSSVQQKNDVSEENCKSEVTENTSNQSNCRSERTVGYRITTPSVDSGTQSEFSPVNKEDGDNINILTTSSTNDIVQPTITNGDSCEAQNSFDVSESEEKDHFDSNNLSNYEGELKKLTQKIHTLTVNSDLKGNGIGGLDADTHSSSSTGCISPMSSEGGVYPQELMDNFALNLHRIDKDVQRCDRNLSYFTDKNLEKLRNVITTYVWDNLDIGYMQGMCDLAGPLLVVFDDESLTHSCFSHLMERMICNFPNGSQMDENFANMRSLIQVLDQSLYDTIQQNGDFSHFYFCYRWFLLDFKREFTYEDTYLVWETIWASSHVVSSHFYLFVALALVETYRDIILDRQMDFTDIIKFFNEMAEKHEAVQVLDMARQLVSTLQAMMADK